MRLDPAFPEPSAAASPVPAPVIAATAPESTPGPAPDSQRTRAKAVALLSGGLDSMLAVRIVARLGLDVTALTFMTHFGCSAGIEGSSCGHDPTKIAAEGNFKVKLCHLGQEYIDMVRKPKHGHGKNMNPCVDCRIMMLGYAKDYAEAIGASFLFTGEVLGQRPMSQRLDAFRIVDREVGMEGRILRPLSAKLLKPTIPEEEGLIDREKLYAIHGRTRKAQMELAAEFGIKEFPTPAGGCLLTDPRFSEKLRDLFAHADKVKGKDIHLLKIGRHFRLSEDWKLVVGRDEGENTLLEQYAEDGDYWLEAIDHPGAVALGRGRPGENGLELAARIVLRYGKAPKDAPARVLVRLLGGEGASILSVGAAEEAALEPLRV
ncbi:MAG: hypothetical protein HYZ53_20400 [Planctomycetes bacterium]|nr:hypothetical protein [Planctomycetota bacterium]